MWVLVLITRDWVRQNGFTQLVGEKVTTGFTVTGRGYWNISFCWSYQVTIRKLAISYNQEEVLTFCTVDLHVHPVCFMRRFIMLAMLSIVFTFRSSYYPTYYLHFFLSCGQRYIWNSRFYSKIKLENLWKQDNLLCTASAPNFNVFCIKILTFQLEGRKYSAP